MGGFALSEEWMMGQKAGEMWEEGGRNGRTVGRGNWDQYVK